VALKTVRGKRWTLPKGMTAKEAELLRFPLHVSEKRKPTGHSYDHGRVPGNRIK
jgi:hypothetical protein